MCKRGGASLERRRAVHYSVKANRLLDEAIRLRRDVEPLKIAPSTTSTTTTNTVKEYQDPIREDTHPHQKLSRTQTKDCVVSLGFIGFYLVILVLLGFTGFYWILLGFTGFLLVFTRFYMILLFFLLLLLRSDVFQVLAAISDSE